MLACRCNTNKVGRTRDSLRPMCDLERLPHSPGPGDRWGTPRSLKQTSLTGRVWNMAPFTPTDSTLRLPSMQRSPRTIASVQWAHSGSRVNAQAVIAHARNETLPNCRKLNESRANLWASLQEANAMLNSHIREQTMAHKHAVTRLANERTPRPAWGLHDYKPVLR